MGDTPSDLPASARGVQAGDKPPGLTASAGVVLAGIPGLAFGIVALFQAGYLTYFGLPMSAVSIDVPLVFADLGSMFRVGISSWEGRLVFISLLIIGVPALGTLVSRKLTDATLTRYAITLFSVALISFSLTPLIWAPFHIPLVALTYILCVRRQKGMSDDECRVQEALENRFHLTRWLEVGVFRLVLVGLLTVPAAFFAGYRVAEGGILGGDARFAGATDTTESGNRHYYLAAIVRPEFALGITVAPADTKDQISKWHFVAPLRFVVFDKPLANGFVRCESSDKLTSTPRSFSDWAFYQPVQVVGTLDLNLGCKVSDIPVSITATPEEETPHHSKSNKSITKPERHHKP